MKGSVIAVATAAALALGPLRADAATIAIFGDNSIDNFLLSQGNTVTLVTDPDLATDGFLNPFDLFIYTRNSDSFGVALSTAAAANVQAFVKGNVVLFASDLADVIGSTAPQGENANADQALLNAVSFADNKGFIGEFTGACAGMTGGSGLVGTRLGFVPGDCTGSSRVAPPRTEIDMLDPGHPVAAGLPASWSVGGGGDVYAITNTAQLWIVAEGSDPQGSNPLPAILATPVRQVPEPGSLALLGLSVIALFVARRSGKSP